MNWLGCIASLAIGAAAPDWAQTMAGSWTGAGVRTTLSTGQKTRIEVVVQSEWLGDGVRPALVSRNHFVEPERVPVRSYDRTYWIAETARSNGRGELVLGYGDEPGLRPASVGFFEAGVLHSEQVIGDASAGMVLRSVTDLSDPERVLYRESITLAGVQQSRTEIVYHFRESARTLCRVGLDY